MSHLNLTAESADGFQFSLNVGRVAFVLKITLATVSRVLVLAVFLQSMNISNCLAEIVWRLNGDFSMAILADAQLLPPVPVVPKLYEKFNQVAILLLTQVELNIHREVEKHPVAATQLAIDVRVCMNVEL